MQSLGTRQASNAAEDNTMQSILRFHIGTHFELGSYLDRYIMRVLLLYLHIREGLA